MGLFSLFRKNKQESASDQGEFRSRSDEQSSALRTRSSRAANTSGGARGKAGKDAGADPLLPEKKRARRRLIGAVALALAVVIVLPMVLDSEPKPLNDDIAIQIPSKDQPATNAAATGAQPAPAQPVDNGKLASAASALDQKEEIVEPSTVAPVAAPVTPPPVASVAPVKPVEKPVAKPEEKKPVPAPHKEEPKKEEPKKEAPKKETPKPKAAEQHGDDSARALAILEGKSNASSASADKKPAAAANKFVIQVAALATQDKVNELRNKLSGAGIHSYTQKIATQGGDRTRIRVGPFGNRDEAEKMGARIKKLGLNATIVPA